MKAAEAVRGSELVSDRFMHGPGFMQVTGRGIDKYSLLYVVEFVGIAFAFLL